MVADECHQSTCIAATDAYLCLVEQQTYVKIIKKINAERYQRMGAFLKQITIIKNWTHKEISFFISQLQIREYAVPGSLVMEEGQPAFNILIVKDGEFEISKRKTTNVFMNAESGTVQINVSQMKRIKTKCQVPLVPPQSKFGQNSLYMGTEL